MDASSSLICKTNDAKYGSIGTVETGNWSDESSPTASYSHSETSSSSSTSTSSLHGEAIDDAVDTAQAMHEITHMPVADEHGHLVHYPGEEQDHLERDVYLHAKNKKRLHLETFLETFKNVYSTALLALSIGVVMAAIFSKQTVATSAGLSPWIASIIFWILIAWLAQMEGGQACLVGLQPIDKSLYAKSHPQTHQSTTPAHKGDNMERFIVGRQFLVCLVVFTSNLMAASVPLASIPYVSDVLTESFLESGVAVTLIAIMIGQSAQINAANCMLDFINDYAWVVTTYLSLILDMSGLLHSVYLFQIIFAKLANTPIESDEAPRNTVQTIWFWIRVAFSTSVLMVSFAVTISALQNGQTTMYAGVPPTVSLVLLVLLLCFVGVLEGMQIALFAVVNLPSDDLKDHPLAARSCELTFRGSNLQAFLIGRQMCVTLCMFVVARLTSCDVHLEVGDEAIFGVSKNIQDFFNTGMLGAFITTIVGSLAWRIIASTFPVAFLSNPLIYAIIRLCLLVEASGMCSVAWLLAIVQKRFIFGYQLDEVHIGTTEERAIAASKRAAVDGDSEYQGLLEMDV